MAVFNPQIQPTQDPNYLNYARVVEAPTPKPVIEDKSTGMALTTAATGIEGAVSMVDTAIKKGIQNKAYAAVDPIRDDFTAGLEKLKGNLDQGIIPAPVQAVGGPTASRSILDSNAMMDDPDLPAGLSSGLDRINQLAAAKAAGSVKLNDTQYAKDTLSVAKQLRAQYGTGYREYIDSEVSKASGLPVANSYYQNMLQDINRQLNQMGKTKDDVATMMEKNSDVPNMGTYYQKYNAGDPSITKTMIYQKINDYNVLKGQIQLDAAKRAESSDNLQTRQRTDEASVTKTFNGTVDGYLKDVVNLSGMPGLGSTMQYYQDVQAGKHPEASDAEVKQRLYNLQAYRQGIDLQLRTQANNMGTSLDSDRLEKLRKNALAPIDALIALGNDKDASPAMYHAHQNAAIQEDDKYSWIKSNDKGPLSRQMLVGRAIMGEQYFPTWIRNIVSQPGPDGKPLDGPIQAAFGVEAMSAIAPITDKRGQPIPRFMKDALIHGKEVDVDNPNYFGKVVGLVGNIADPKMPDAAKDRLIKWAFDPQHNAGVLNELKMDYIDPTSGQPVPGKYSAFKILSAPAVTNAVRQTSMYHPENYQMYKSTIEGEFGTLYRNDVNDLNKIMQKPYLNAHFSYNNVTNNFGLVDNNNRPIKANDRALGIENPNAVYINNMLGILGRVNNGLDNLSVVHKNDPTGSKDTSQYLLQTLQTIGFRPGENITGATEGMAKAIIKAHQPDMTPADLAKKLLAQ